MSMRGNALTTATRTHTTPASPGRVDDPARRGSSSLDGGGGRPVRVGAATTAPTTARELIAVVGGVDLDVLRAHHVELTTTIAELARDAGMDWPWCHDDPTVALLRAISKLALVAPDAASELGTDLCRRLEPEVEVFAHACRELVTLGASS